jgi:hypothetical protein
MNGANGFYAKTQELSFDHYSPQVLNKKNTKCELSVYIFFCATWKREPKVHTDITTERKRERETEAQ